MNIQQMNLIKMIRCVVHNAPCETLTEPDFEQIASIAGIHKLSGFLFESLPHLPANQQPSAEEQKSWKQIYRSLLVRDANQRYEFERLIDAFVSAKIKTLAVKGFSVADIYPNSAMRTMSDLDILYDEADFDSALALMKSLEYQAGSVENGSTDHFVSETGLHVEMHRSLFESRMPDAAKPYLSQIFSLAEEKRPYQYALSAEDSYLYLILHTYKHFIYAGTGIRSVLDFYFFKELPMDRNYVTNRCKQFGIETFLREFEQLSEVWFSGAEAASVSEQLGNYIADCGVYGTDENKLHYEMRQVSTGRGGSKLKYILRRFFLPYHAMKSEYPVLKKLPILLPFFWIYRAFYALVHRRSKLSGEIQSLNHYDSRQTDSISELMQALEIHR
ncbi:MAG: nucleotidyltransferase family protein [Clostridia bacterium]|nr:nucleotidyltransferase family protein [Clostridia bacterium]